jgi:hypothetical protein
MLVISTSLAPNEREGPGEEKSVFQRKDFSLRSK